MGGTLSSRDKCDPLHNCCCDFKLVIMGSRIVESNLETLFGAEGRGLHEKLTDALQKLQAQGISIPKDFERRVRRMASVRNSIVHQQGEGMDADGRARFQHDLKLTRWEIKELDRELCARRDSKANAASKSESKCVIS